VSNGSNAKLLALHYRLINTFRFQLVSWNVEAILREPTIYRRREMLSNITDALDLGDAYGNMIERIEAQGASKSRLGMDPLMWISHAERLLTEDELCQALAIDPASTSFDSDNVPSISTVVGCCQGLINGGPGQPGANWAKDMKPHPAEGRNDSEADGKRYHRLLGPGGVIALRPHTHTPPIHIPLPAS